MMAKGGTFLMELFEAVAARLGVDWLADKASRGAKEATASGAPAESDQKRDKMDYHLLINSDRFMPIQNRRNLREAIERLPRRDWSRAERAVGSVLSDGRDGFFKPRVAVKDAPAVYPAGYEPETMTMEFLKNSTATPEAADLFLAGLLQESRAQQAQDAAEKFGGWALLIFGGYLLLIIVSLIGAVVCFNGAIENPEQFSTFAWGLFWFTVFAVSATPLAKLILPKE